MKCKICGNIIISGVVSWFCPHCGGGGLIISEDQSYEEATSEALAASG